MPIVLVVALVLVLESAWPDASRTKDDDEDEHE
jgi:hypothetical protein